MSFQSVTRLALQPSVLDLDPAMGRQLFQRDLARQRTQSNPEQDTARHELAIQLAEKERTSGAHGFGHLQPNARQPRYPRVPGQQQAMLDGILREQSLAEYDRRAPLIREEMARARP